MLKNLPNIHWKKKKEKPLESLSLFKNQLGSLNFTQNQLSRPKVLEIGKWVCSKCRNGAIKRETMFSRIILFKSTKHWKERKKIQVALTLAISSALIRTNSFLLWEPAMSLPLVSIYSLSHKKKPLQSQLTISLSSPLSLFLSLITQKPTKLETLALLSLYFQFYPTLSASQFKKTRHYSTTMRERRYI